MKKYEGIVRGMITNEDQLVNNRMVWMAAFNGLLFAALGFAWEKSGTDFLLKVICVLGILSSLLNGIAVEMACFAQRRVLLWWHSNKPPDYAGPGVMGSEPLDSRLYSIYFSPWFLLCMSFMVSWAAILFHTPGK